MTKLINYPYAYYRRVGSIFLKFSAFLNSCLLMIMSVKSHKFVFPCTTMSANFVKICDGSSEHIFYICKVAVFLSSFDVLKSFPISSSIFIFTLVLITGVNYLKIDQFGNNLSKWERLEMISLSFMKSLNFFELISLDIFSITLCASNLYFM